MVTRYAMVGPLNDRHMAAVPDGDYVKWADVAEAAAGPPVRHETGCTCLDGRYCAAVAYPEAAAGPREHQHERIEHEHTGYPWHVHEIAEAAAGPRREDVEWLVWYARKKKGTVAEVTQRALDENPGLRPGGWGAESAAGPRAEGPDVERLTLGMVITSWPAQRTEYERGWNEALAAVRERAKASER